MRTTVVAVGRLQPPYADDVQHYQKLLARHTRLELIEVREEQSVDGRIPADTYVVLLASEGQQFDSMEFSRFIDERRLEARDGCFVIGGPRGVDLAEGDLRLCPRPLSPPPPPAPVVWAPALLPPHTNLVGEAAPPLSSCLGPVVRI